VSERRRRITINLDNFKKKCISAHFLPYLDTRSRFLILYGGTGSGKSWFVAQKLLYRCLLSFQNKIEKFLVVMKTRESLKKAAYQQLVDLVKLYNLECLCRITQSPMKILFRNGSQILFTGLDKPDLQLKSLPSLSSIWLEEADLLTREDLKQVNIRLRGYMPTYGQIILTFNPTTCNSWIKADFFDQEVPNTTLDRSTYLDNPFLPVNDPAIQEVIRLKDIDPVFYSVYALGQWGILQESIFQNFEIVADLINDKDITTRMCGLDFGVNDPSALVEVALDKFQNVYVVSELYKRGLSNIELYHKLTPWKSRQIYCDTDPAKIKDFLAQGFRMKAAQKGSGSIMLGIDWLRCRKIFIHESCVNFIKEINSYVYKKDRSGNILDYTPDPKCSDHLMDALRYAVSGLVKPVKFEYLVGGYRETSYINDY